MHNIIMKNTIDEFIKHIKIFKKYSLSCVKQYNNHLNDFYRYISYKKKYSDRSDVQIKDVIDYLQVLSAKKITWSSRYYWTNTTISDWTLATYANTVIQFYKRLRIYWDKEYLNPLMIPKIRVAHPKIDFLTEEEIEKLLLIPETIERRRDIALRNKLYIMMLYVTWCRATEILQLKMSEITQSKEIVIKGKGNKYRSVYINDRVYQLYQEYIQEREKPYINSLWIEFSPKKSEYVFVSLDDARYWHPLSYISIMNLFLKYSKYIEKKVNAHMLRHSFATKMLRSGIRERYIQVSLGHANITTTQRYMSVTNLDLSNIHNKVFW